MASGKKRRRKSKSPSAEEGATPTPTNSAPKRHRSKKGDRDDEDGRRAGGKLRAVVPSTNNARSSSSSTASAGGFSFDRDELARRVSTFLNEGTGGGHGRTPNASSGDGTAGSDDDDDHRRSEGPSDDADDTVSYLVEFLEADPEGDMEADAIVTKEDVATLLLPRAVSSLVRSASSSDANDKNGDNDASKKTREGAAWRALSSCLRALSPSRNEPIAEEEENEESEGALSAALSQGALRRLVPRAALVAFSSSEDASRGRSRGAIAASDCFVRLARRYRPSLDDACNSLLGEVDSLVSSASATRGGGGIVLVPAHQRDVVSATLRLIHSLMADANPKRTFAIVCSEGVFPRLGRMMTKAAGESDPSDAGEDPERLVRSILWDGLFNPTHHLEGFRAMGELRAPPSPPRLDATAADDADGPTASENRPGGSGGGKAGGRGGKDAKCFRSALFASLRASLGAAGAEDVDNDAAATARLLPTIVRGFFERIGARAGPRSSSSPEGDAGIRFRFWCVVALPALERLFQNIGKRGEEEGEEGGSTSLALLRATSETLGLVSEYDAYLPSYEDPGGRSLTFLQGVAGGLLGLAASPSGEEARRELEASFRRLLSLNHRLLHDELARVIGFACSSRSPRDSRAPKNELLLLIVRTYRELRQVGYLLASARGAFAAAGQGAGRTFADNLLGCGNVTESLSMAYQSLPSGQLREIWHFYDSWIADVVRKFEDGTEYPNAEDASAATATAELSFAVRMFVVFVRNVRADRQNSPELRGLCEKSAATSVSNLLGRAGSGGDVSADSVPVRRGLDLCGWLVDLHTRSCFWIDDVRVDGRGSSFLLSRNEDENGSGVLAYLRNAAEAAVSSESHRTWRDSWLPAYWQSTDRDRLEKFSDIGVPAALRGSLQRLALHRVHQLHSMIYYCNLEEDERDGSNQDEDDRSSSSRALADEARTLVDFSIYVACSQTAGRSSAEQRDASTDESSSESLWSPVAQSLCTWTNYADPFHAEVFLIWFFSALCESRPTDGRAPNRQFELERKIALILARDASFYGVGEIASSFVEVGTKFAFRRLIDAVEAPPRGLSEKIFREPGGAAVTACIKFAESGAPKLSLGDDVDTVHTALSFVASAPLELALCNRNIRLLDRVLGLAVVASRAADRAPGVDEQERRLSGIVQSSAIIVASVLPKTLLFSSDFDAPCLVNMARRLSDSCFGCGFDDGVVSATGKAIGEYFSMCNDYYEKDASMLISFLEQISFSVRAAEDVGFAAKALLIRSIIRRMNMLDRHRSLMKKATSANVSAYDLCMNFVQETQKNYRDEILQHMERSGNIPEHDKKAASAALLLASEIFSFIGNHVGTKPVEECVEIVQKVFDLISNVQDSQHREGFNEARDYFLSSMAICPGHFLQGAPSLSLLKGVLKALAQSFTIGQESPLLDAAACSLIRNAGLVQTEIITNFVLRESNGGKRHDTSFIIKLFHLLMVCANSPEQHKHISGKCKTFLLISMGLLRDRRCARSKLVFNVDLFSKTMSTLISKKELLLLSGREIAMICSEFNPLFPDGGADQNDVDGDVDIFNSCCSVVASLVAHYPKQLYGCPSPVFSLLLALLTHLLHGNAKKGLSQKMLEYAKVCELLIPHKDIFKKHVVGLILCYIQNLNKGMNPTTKSRLMPSIYALLDMCSDFETRQINAMIDVPSKTLFAPVFQSYQKYYQYHGQA